MWRGRVSIVVHLVQAVRGPEDLDEVDDQFMLNGGENVFASLFDAVASRRHQKSEWSMASQVHYSV